MKREPTLADRFTAGHTARITSTLRPEDHAELIRQTKSAQRKTFSAEKFVFDRAASERVGIVLRDVPELLVEQIQFARPPFDLCWIEYDSDAIYRVLNPHAPLSDDETRDRRVGILIDHHRITVVSESFNGRFGVMPCAYHLNTEWPFAEQTQFSEQLRVSRRGIDYWLWGSVAPYLVKTGKQDYLRALRDTNKAELLFNVTPTDAAATRLYNSTIGDFKNHVAVLLLLNQPSVTQYIRVPQMRGLIGRRPRPYMAYNTVRVALDPVPQIRRLGEGGGTGDLRRRHRVRGHYCHNDKARRGGCIHDWHAADAAWTPVTVRIGDDPEHWVCPICGGHRWWRAQHERGDASKGYVDHEYTVTL